MAGTDQGRGTPLPFALCCPSSSNRAFDDAAPDGGKLRDGVLLCAAYQSGECATKGDACADGRHRCAVLLQSGRICGGTHGAGECRVKGAIQAPESPPRTGTRAKAAPVVLRPKAKGKPEVKAMPKPNKMPQDSQLPPLKLKRMRLSLQEPKTPPPGHVVLVEPDSPQGRGAEVPQPSTPPRSRPPLVQRGEPLTAGMMGLPSAAGGHASRESSTTPTLVANPKPPATPTSWSSAALYDQDSTRKPSSRGFHRKTFVRPRRVTPWNLVRRTGRMRIDIAL